MVDALKVIFETLNMDGRLLREAQERVNLASKVIAADEAGKRSQRNKQWVKEKAEAADLEFDDEMLDDGLLESDSKQLHREASRAKDKLQSLLAQPLKSQRFGKFLSTNAGVNQLPIWRRSAPPSERAVGRKRKRTSRS